MFSWTKKLVGQVVKRILDAVLWPSPVTEHWVACQQNLCQTWEWTLSAPWDKMVTKYSPQNHGQVYEQKGALPTENWHFLSTSTKIKSWPPQLLTFNSPERSSGWKSWMRHSVLWGKLAEQAFRWLDLFRRRCYELKFLHLLIPRETLMSLMVTSALAIKENFTIKCQNRVAMVQTSWEITRWYYGCNFRLDLVLLNTWGKCLALLTRLV